MATKKQIKKVTKNTKQKPKTKGKGKGKNVGNKIRYFKVIYEGVKDKEFGRFSGKKPKQAANKGLTSITKRLIKEDKPAIGREIKFAIIECTRGSKKKTYYYKGMRKELDDPQPVEIKVKDEPIIYKYCNKLSKIKNDKIKKKDIKKKDTKKKDTKKKDTKKKDTKKKDTKKKDTKKKDTKKKDTKKKDTNKKDTKKKDTNTKPKKDNKKK